MKLRNSDYDWHEWPTEEPPTDRQFLLRFECPNGYCYYCTGQRPLIEGKPHWHDYRDMRVDQNRLINGETFGDATMRLTYEKGIRIFWTVDHPGY